MKKLCQKIMNFLVKNVGTIHWKSKKSLTEEDKQQIKKLLVTNYYIIATRRTNYLGSFCVRLAHFLVTGRWGYYSHVLMNLEDEVHSDEDFRLVEATTKKGVNYSTFDEVFNDVSAVALLIPKGMTNDEWNEIFERTKLYIGKPYDTMFDYKNDKALSCVEGVRNALMGLKNYYYRFANFEATIANARTITPQMFLESPDFEVVFEIKR